MDSDIAKFSAAFSRLIEDIWARMLARKDRFSSTTVDYPTRKTWNAYTEYESLVYAFYLFSDHLLPFQEQNTMKAMPLPEYANQLADAIASFILEPSVECPPCMQAKLARIQNDLAEMVRQGDAEILKNADVGMYI